MKSSSEVPVITIDGPGGAGKGTISTIIAARLGWHYLDSGAMYRLLALAALRHGLASSDEQALVNIAAEMKITFSVSSNVKSAEGQNAVEVWLNGEQVSTAIRSEECGVMASEIAVYGAVREALLARQKALRQPPGLVADGRDMGTVVFPDATLKVFLTASADERAQRRYKQLIAKGIDVILCDLLKDIQARDERDTTRSLSPLRPAEDAITIDTTDLTIDQVVEQIMNLLL
jgi:cytidylate kinase